MKKRIISAIIAAILVIPLIIIGGYPFAIGASVLAILAYKEILDLKESHKEIPNMMILIGLVCLLVLVLSNLRGYSITYGITYQKISFIMIALLLPVLFYKENEYTTKDALYLLGMTLFLGITFNLIIVLRNRGLFLLLYILAIPMLNDIFAYFGGCAIGKRKMSPTISPNKTWEGSIIGAGVGTIVGCIIYSCLVASFSVKLVVLTLILSIIGQMGDLFMSKIKRENGIKDFSNIMPGHGGILDRLDSTIFVTLAYVALMFIL